LKSRRTICCHCEARCGVVVDVDERGEPRAIRGDREDANSRGFICVRGQAAVDYFADPGRLNVPLRRSGPRGSGAFTEVSWDEALDDIAERLLRIAEVDGPEGVALLQGRQFASDSKFGTRLMHKFGSPNVGGVGLMCGGPQFVAGALTFGFGSAFPEVVPGVTGLVVLWGQQPSASAPPYWGAIRRAMRAGAKLVVVDPRPTQEARAADLWLQPRPASDAALALAVLNVVVTEALWDRDFVSAWTHGFDRLRERVAPFTPEATEPVTGVPAVLVRELARLYAEAPAAALSPGTPNGQGRNALNAERALCILIALTGKLDREGCNRLLGPTRDAGSEVTYDAYEDLSPSRRARRLGSERFRLHGEGVEILSRAASRVWYGIPYPITRAVLGVAHPLAIFDAIDTGEPYPVRALLVQHHNPIGAYNGSARIARTLASDRLELLVVHELRLTPTAMLADYVLPAASWMEKPFLFSPGWGTPIVAGEQVTRPRHERRSDYELCRDLGRRIGQVWPETVEEVFDEWLAPAGTTYGELLEGPRFLPGTQTRRRFEELDPAGRPYGFGTPTGKVELSSTVLEELGYDPLPDFDDAGDPRETFPLRLMTGATRIDATHQDHRHVEKLRKRHPDPIVDMDPRTATEIGVVDGDWVRIVTPTGEIRQRARLVPGLGADRVSAERWWYPERDGARLFDALASNANAYTSSDLDRCDPAYGGLPYREAHCRVERA
jgi:thiosulfate reductase/polysulfide reductase chain A